MTRYVAPVYRESGDYDRHLAQVPRWFLVMLLAHWIHSRRGEP